MAFLVVELEVRIRDKFKKLMDEFTKNSVSKMINRLPNTRVSETKLIMTLLVRDEIDVIKKNIDFHLSQGVDYIIATDNGSVDGTLEALQEYELKGVLHLIQEPEQTYSQSLWVNRMGKIACEEFNADIVFHCDADEFWMSRSGNLKHELCAREKVDTLNVRVINVLLKDRGGVEQFPDDAVYCVVSPLETDNLEEDSKHTSMYLYRYPQSVMFRTTHGALEVGMGNHSILNSRKLSKAWSTDITIYHYPIRSKTQFIMKVVNGGASLEANPSLGKKVGWHWRRWYEQYKTGQLEQAYRMLILSEMEAHALVDDGVVLESNPIRNLI